MSENEFTDKQWWRFCVAFGVAFFGIGLCVGIYVGTLVS